MTSDTNKKPKILAVVGPTASGKSDLAVLFAQRFNGEVVSADSRQVYRGLDIATGKITKEEMNGVSHHLLDVAHVSEQYTVTQFKRDAEAAIANILSRKKVPILTGGTGFYIQAIVDNVAFPEVPPNPTLRKELASKDELHLFRALEKLDPNRALTIDPQNKRRLVRALEIVAALKAVPQQQADPHYVALQIGIAMAPAELRKKINARVVKRIELGMIEEAKRLHEQGLTYQRMDELGLEYRLLAELLQNNITHDEFIERLQVEIWRYAKRQLTWFKKDKRVRWFSLEHIEEIEKEIKKFLER